MSPGKTRDMKCFGHCPDTHSWSRAGSREQEVTALHTTCPMGNWPLSMNRESLNKYSRHLSVLEKKQGGLLSPPLDWLQL